MRIFRCLIMIQIWIVAINLPHLPEIMILTLFSQRYKLNKLMISTLFSQRYKQPNKSIKLKKKDQMIAHNPHNLH